MERNVLTGRELAAQAFVVESLPKVIRVEPAAACNLKCVHCPTGTNQPMRGERGVMTKETFAVVTEALRRNVPDVVVLYHGGEPLLNKRFVDMVHEVKSLGVRYVKTVSNGMLLDASTASGLIAAGLDAIEFSLDGSSPQENDTIRVGCSYVTVVQNIKRLLDLVAASGGPHPEVVITNTQFFDSAEHRDLTSPQTPRYLQEEFQGPNGNRVQFKQNFAMFWPGLAAERYERVDNAQGRQSKHVDCCDHLVNTITIRWNGDVVPCCYDITSRYVIGNIHNTSLEDLWNNARYRSLREAIYRGTYPPLCQDCHVVRSDLYLAFKAGDQRV